MLAKEAQFLREGFLNLDKLQSHWQSWLKNIFCSDKGKSLEQDIGWKKQK
jgi:hypothetical protein